MSVASKHTRKLVPTLVRTLRLQKVSERTQTSFLASSAAGLFQTITLLKISSKYIFHPTENLILKRFPSLEGIEIDFARQLPSREIDLPTIAATFSQLTHVKLDLGSISQRIVSELCCGLAAGMQRVKLLHVRLMPLEWGFEYNETAFAGLFASLPPCLEDLDFEAPLRA